MITIKDKKFLSQVMPQPEREVIDYDTIIAELTKQVIEMGQRIEQLKQPEAPNAVAPIVNFVPPKTIPPNLIAKVIRDSDNRIESIVITEHKPSLLG